MTSKDRNDTINAQAADYAARVGDPDQPPEEAARLKAELHAWLDADSRHLGAYTRALAFMVHAERAIGTVGTYDPDSFLARETGTPGMAARSPGPPPPRRGFWAATAAVVAAACLATVLAWWPQVDNGEVYETAIGEMRVLPLADGSTMTLNTASRAVVSFAGNKRTVRLEAGEAFFNVARDEERPFIVQADHARVRVVGTRFNLRHLGNRSVALTVQEGAVDIRRNSQDAPESMRVGAHEKVYVPVSRPMEQKPLTADMVDRAIAWKDGMVFFDATSLEEAAREFMRYNRVHIRIPEPDLAKARVTGYFSARNPHGFAEAVAETLGLKLIRQPNLIIMRYANPGTPARLNDSPEDKKSVI